MHVQFSPNVICPLCSQAWLAAVSWLDDEIRPAVAQMVWFLMKKRENCHSAVFRFRYFNKDSVYFNTFFYPFFYYILIIHVQPFLTSLTCLFLCLHLNHLSHALLLFLLYFPPVLPFVIPLLSPTLSSPLALSLPNPSVPLLSPVSESQLPTLNQQAAEDCGNPWNRRDQGCRQGATATLECGASEEIRAVSPARERGRGGEGGEGAERG